MHYLIVLARIAPEATPPLTELLADALLALDKKVRRRTLNRDTHWPLRVGELYEELELEFDEAEYFTRFDFDLTTLGAGRYYRMFFVVPVSAGQYARLVLHEGEAFGAFPGETVCRDLKVTPYDAFALFLHHSRTRVGS